MLLWPEQYSVWLVRCAWQPEALDFRRVAFYLNARRAARMTSKQYLCHLTFKVVRPRCMLDVISLTVTSLASLQTKSGILSDLCPFMATFLFTCEENYCPVEIKR